MGSVRFRHKWCCLGPAAEPPGNLPTAAGDTIKQLPEQQYHSMCIAAAAASSDRTRTTEQTTSQLYEIDDATVTSAEMCTLHSQHSDTLLPPVFQQPGVHAAGDPERLTTAELRAMSATTTSSDDRASTVSCEFATAEKRERANAARALECASVAACDDAAAVLGGAHASAAEAVEVTLVMPHEATATAHSTQHATTSATEQHSPDQSVHADTMATPHASSPSTSSSHMPNDSNAADRADAHASQAKGIDAAQSGSTAGGETDTTAASSSRSSGNSNSTSAMLAQHDGRDGDGLVETTEMSLDTVRVAVGATAATATVPRVAVMETTELSLDDSVKLPLRDAAAALPGRAAVDAAQHSMSSAALAQLNARPSNGDVGQTAVATSMDEQRSAPQMRRACDDESAWQLKPVPERDDDGELLDSCSDAIVFCFDGDVDSMIDDMIASDAANNTAASNGAHSPFALRRYDSDQTHVRHHAVDRADDTAQLQRHHTDEQVHKLLKMIEDESDTRSHLQPHSAQAQTHEPQTKRPPSPESSSSSVEDGDTAATARHARQHSSEQRQQSSDVITDSCKFDRFANEIIAAQAAADAAAVDVRSAALPHDGSAAQHGVVHSDRSTDDKRRDVTHVNDDSAEHSGHLRDSVSAAELVASRRSAHAAANNHPTASSMPMLVNAFTQMSRASGIPSECNEPNHANAAYPANMQYQPMMIIGVGYPAATMCAQQGFAGWGDSAQAAAGGAHAAARGATAATADVSSDALNDCPPDSHADMADCSVEVRTWLREARPKFSSEDSVCSSSIVDAYHGPLQDVAMDTKTLGILEEVLLDMSLRAMLDTITTRSVTTPGNCHSTVKQSLRTHVDMLLQQAAHGGAVSVLIAPQTAFDVKHWRHRLETVALWADSVSSGDALCDVDEEHDGFGAAGQQRQWIRHHRYMKPRLTVRRGEHVVVAGNSNMANTISVHAGGTALLLFVDNLQHVKVKGHAILIGCTITDSSSHGLLVLEGGDAVAIGCRFSHCAQSGCHIAGRHTQLLAYGCDAQHCKEAAVQVVDAARAVLVCSSMHNSRDGLCANGVGTTVACVKCCCGFNGGYGVHVDCGAVARLQSKCLLTANALYGIAARDHGTKAMCRDCALKLNKRGPVQRGHGAIVKVFCTKPSAKSRHSIDSRTSSSDFH